MSEDGLALLELAKAQARKEARLSLGASTPDGRNVDAYAAINKTWRNGWGLAVYAKALLGKDKKPTAAGGFDVTKDL